MAKSKSQTGNDRGLVNVLLARFSAFGDVAMTIPVVYSACRCYPDVHFVMVTRPAMTGMFVEAPDNLTVIGADIHDRYRGVRGISRLVQELCARWRFDAFIDLHDVLRTRLMGLLCRLRGIPVKRLNKGRARKRALTRRRNKVMLPLISQRARYREAFFKAGLPLTDRFDGLFGGRGKADPGLFARITPPKRRGERWVGIAPFAAHAGKIYPIDRMERVVEALAARPDTHIFLFGGAGDEAETLNGWAAKHPQTVTCLAGKKYGFGAELALLNHIDVMVSMDSANMHLASIAGAPTVSVWGATHPYCGFKGWRQADTDMVQLPMTCRPCSVFGQKPCYRGDYLCLRAIKPETILAKVTEKLGTEPENG